MGAAILFLYKKINWVEPLVLNGVVYSMDSTFVQEETNCLGQSGNLFGA